MAGGTGSRFWPISRAERPKQFIDILGLGKTFIQLTYERFARIVPQENIFVVTASRYYDLLLEQLPQIRKENILLEPYKRNTAPCIAYATYKLLERNPDATVVVTPADKSDGDEEEKNENSVLPAFTQGEHGPHEPKLSEKTTTAPKPYTEATLLRAMETAGKLVDDESLREALKENGIGRPSTRAAIIETLFKRNYIKKARKSLEPTPTGIELIGLIKEELLKSAELTGIWEKKLREIEQNKYSATQFLDELKQMVNDIVLQVLRDDSDRRQNVNPDSIIGQPCPICHKGHIIKGKTAYGCSEWKSGCPWRQKF